MMIRTTMWHGKMRMSKKYKRREKTALISKSTPMLGFRTLLNVSCICRKGHLYIYQSVTFFACIIAWQLYVRAHGASGGTCLGAYSYNTFSKFQHSKDAQKSGNFVFS